jgi:NAD(P)-dependent dehydrogenase (short-subunit alcohol dehydrogenase family)
MKLIVTGAGGAPGAATTALLERQGHEVARLVRSAVPHKPLSIACEDLADAEAAERSIGTPANRPTMPDADPSSWTHPDAIAAVAAFLVSPAARAVNGALLPVTNAVAR